MIVKVLVENGPGPDLCAEHGLCLYVEYNKKRYLIDSGASDLFAKNADKMGVDLSQIDAAFLSHAHYDHAGGYPEFFARNTKANVYLQQSSVNRYFYKVAGPIRKYIGIPKGLLGKYADRFVYIDGAAQVDEGIFIVPHSSDGILERAKRTHMCAEVDHKIQTDDFSHEQTVVFEEADGLVCFNSCSHAGVDLIIDEIKKAFPDRKIKAYFGGFHMMGTGGASTCGYSKKEVQDVAERIKASGDTGFYSGHCTGTIAYAWLKEVLGDRLDALHTGKEIRV